MTSNSEDNALTALLPMPLSPTEKLEHIVVVLAAGVDLGHAVDNLAERMPRPKSRTDSSAP